MKKRKNNVQLVKDIMTHSEFGSLSQAFVMDAIAQHAERVSKLSPKDFSKNSFIHPPAWIGVAKEIKGKLDAQEAA